MPGPLCRYCGEPIKKKTRTVYLRARELTPHEQGPHEFCSYVQVEALPATIAECRKLTNNQVVALKRTEDGRAISYFSTWDGTSYVDDFFCNGDHARRFAYVFAKAGHATKAWQLATINPGERP